MLFRVVEGERAVVEGRQRSTSIDVMSANDVAVVLTVLVVVARRFETPRSSISEVKVVSSI